MSAARHGTTTNYRYGCRCAECKSANTAAEKKRRRERSLAPDDPRHGTGNGYRNYACRCDSCCQANTAVLRAFRQARR